MPLISFVPEIFEDGFKELSSLNDKTFMAIQESLSSAPAVASIDELVSEMINSKTELTKESTEKIFSSVEALIPFLEGEEQVSEAIDDISQIIKPKDAELFKKRLFTLVKSDKIFYASKARELITETENVFLTCKVISDIRPIFGLNMNEEPKAAMVMHNLHIHYQGTLTASHQDIYLSLNSTDIQILINTLIRADEKDVSLKKLINKMNIATINE